MSLDRASVTVASRLMLPVYVVFFAVVGLNYLFTPHLRLVASPSLEYTDHVLNLHVWGGLFLAAAALMLTALLRADRTLYRYALLLCAISMGLFTLAGIAAVFASQASPGGWVYPAFVVAACVASYRSLSNGEVV